MNIDERLDALRQSLELWAQMRRVAKREYEEWSRSLDEMSRAGEAPFRGNEERLVQLMETKERLGRILEKHGQRLDDLESH